MNLADLASFIGGKIGMADAATLAKLKGYATQRYEQIVAAALWKDLLTVYPFTLADEQSTVILPAHVAQFVAAKFDNERLVPVDAAFLFASYPALWDQIGTPTHCSELAPIATKVMPLAAGEALKLKSSDAGDLGNVTIHGEDANGDPQQEVKALNGLALVTTANSYAIVYGLSKAATAGTITVRNNADTATLLSLLPAERQRLHRRVRLHESPAAGVTLAVLGKRHAGPYTADTDAPTLPPLAEKALQAYVHADALEWQRQYGKAQGKFAEAIALEKQAKTEESYQAVQSQRLTPGDGIAEGCSPNDFL